MLRDDAMAHRRLLPLLVELLGTESYLELGVAAGDSLRPVLAAAPPTFRAVAVDVEPINVSDSRVAIFHGTTAEFFATEAARLDRQYDLVLIDAEHGETAVWADLRAVLPYVCEQGVICLHDTFPLTPALTSEDTCRDTWRVAEALGARTFLELEAMTLPVSPGITLIRKRHRHLPWGAP